MLAAGSWVYVSLQWPFQVSKLEVLYLASHISRPGIFHYIALTKILHDLTHCRNLQFRYLKWRLFSCLDCISHIRIHTKQINLRATMVCNGFPFFKSATEVRIYGASWSDQPVVNPWQSNRVLFPFAMSDVKTLVFNACFVLVSWMTELIPTKSSQKSSSFDTQRC
jgi:hypothetical protein